MSLALQIFSTILGFVGTLIMFHYGYNLIPYEGMTFGGKHTAENNKKIRRKNSRIKTMQKVGMGLLTISFALQGLSLIVK
ncbi:TPA: hypothetical protein MHK45_01830 [Klebsiella pneumoniae]|nr:hypothetical protein [Klebsiella pneumoniae]